VVVMDLFSGAGGLSEGFHRENFRIVAHVEKDYWACETLKTRTIFHFLKKNGDLDLYHHYVMEAKEGARPDEYRKKIYEKYPELKQWVEHVVLNKKFGDPNKDPDATSTSEIIRLMEKSLKLADETKVDIIIGGPPCQAYSLVGRGRMKSFAEHDPRNFLFYYYKEIVDHFRPKIFVFENVPGILSAKKGSVYLKIKEEFSSIGYTLLSGPRKNDFDNVVDFSEYGIPQTRKRVLLFGFQSGLNFTYPDFNKHRINWTIPLTTMAVLSDLPSLVPGEGNDAFLGTYGEFDSVPLNEYQSLMRENSIGIMNHKARPINERDREIYKMAIEKASKGIKLLYNHLPERLKTHRNENSFLDRFKVHQANGLPHTVVAHIAKDGHYNIHPDPAQVRSLTVREAARIQTFPDNYKFEGSRTAQYIQVGNAVPPLMSSIIAKTIKEMLSDV